MSYGDVPTTLPILDSSVVITAKVVVARRTNQADALTEACRRLSLLADAVPGKPWRMRVRRNPDARYPNTPWAVTAELS